MKFIKAILAVILLIVSVLVLIAVFVPELDDRFEVKVDRPLLEVYAGMMNVQEATEWVNGLDRIERTSGFLAMPGSTFNLYYTGTETEVMYAMEVIEVVPMESIKFKLHNEMFEFVTTVKFESEGLGTNLNIYVQMKGKSMLIRSVIPLMKSVIMEEAESNFQNFKQFQEQ